MKHLILFSSLLLSIASFSWAQQLTLEELDDIKADKSLEEALENPTKVIKLHLKGDDVFSIRFEIGKFVNLQYLGLTSSKMTEFPLEVTKLINLQYLDLSKNKITKIPDEIAKLENLKYLGMSRNNLYLISPEIGQLKNMEELDLWNNPIKEFPDEMRGMSNLKRMDLRVIQLNDKEKKKLMKMFPDAKLKFSKTCDCN